MNDWQQWVFYIGIGLLVIWGIYRFRKGGESRVQVIGTMIYDINANLKIIEKGLSDWRGAKQFKTGGWSSHKDQIAFLDEEVREATDKAFEMAMDFNEKIITARRTQSNGPLSDIPLEQAKEFFLISRKGMAIWMRDNVQKEYSQKRGFFG
jgi:hypothetical protein